jgi:hypothetical protein
MFNRIKFPVFGRDKPAKVEKSGKVDKQANPFRAVEICPGDPCCQAVHSMVGKRHLSRENPPKLPLPECTRMDQCACRFLHHNDRRAGQRRVWAIIDTRVGQEMLAKQRPVGQVRRSRGRRKDD